jgi:hypothetical protein
MNFKIVLLTILVFLIFLFSSNANVEINEFMQAPYDGNEWFELYNPTNQSINLSGWNITDNRETDQIICCSKNSICSQLILPFDYKVITDQDSTLKIEDNLHLCVDDNSIGNGLGNIEDKIEVFNATYLIAIDYEEGLKNNLSTERRFDGSWGDSLVFSGTPGKENSIYHFSLDYEPLIISEIMANTFNEDDDIKPNGEWIELYNDGDEIIELRGLYFLDKSDENELIISDDKILSEFGPIISPEEFLVIYRNGDSDFSLNNNGYEEVRLYSGDELIDSMSYSGSIEGMTWSNIEGDWYQTLPTPYDYNEIVEECDWLLNMDINESIYLSENFSFEIGLYRFFGKKQDMSVKGEITNINGKVIKSYFPWTNKSVLSGISKKYSPNLPEGIYQIKFWIDNDIIECTDQDITDNQISRLIAINPTFEKFESLLDIETIYLGNDKRAQWGDQFTIKVNLYKGDETRKSVQLWAEIDGEKISKTTKVTINEKYSFYPLTLPIQLDANCNEKIDSGTAKIVIEAFGLRKEKDFIVRGVDKEICRDYLDYVEDLEKDKKRQKISNKIISIPTSSNPGNILPVTVRLTSDDKKRNYEVWSYLYKGRTCYSCKNLTEDRVANKIEIKLNPDEIEDTQLFLKIDEDMKEGEYKVKVKIKKNGQKTNQEITRNIYIQKEKKIHLEPLLVNSEKENENNSSEEVKIRKKVHLESSGFIVYESSSVKAYKLVPYFLSIAFGLTIIVLVMKK